MTVSPWIWLVLCIVIVSLLALDLVVFGRGSAPPTLRRSLGWSLGWTALGAAFAVVLGAWQGAQPAEEYLAGFLIEKSLSMDNVFVFALLFSSLGIPLALRRRVLFFGIVAAIVLRAVFIVAGAAILDAFHAALYVFGAFLVLTGVKMALQKEHQVDPAQSKTLRLLGRIVPLSTEYDGDRLVTRRDNRLVATPLVAAFVLIAVFDIIFAVDSIPAIFAITSDTFVVFAANAFSLLGLASLYFALDGMADRFRYLKTGLAAILVVIGAKMLATDLWKPPVWMSLTAIVALLALSVVASL
ncbi:MAG: TerC/Alx family metal homeostasis membrane protein, partial [Gaiella sp.]